MISDRKLEHLKICTHKDVEYKQKTGFEEIELVHNALPQINKDKIDIKSKFLGKKLNAPIFITGRRRAQARQGRRAEGRGREDRRRVQGSRRDLRNQVRPAHCAPAAPPAREIAFTPFPMRAALCFGGRGNGRGDLVI